ncbi:iron-containing redox enzyme family protein [Actinopolymorpha pittospori]|uniref:Iron-containing redox enzyme n=1 Tax=Actinopolymorpha pittospori TaxID=648752 RepID=A0A927R5N4_9ACTN|nr:hypothetical protein [Actinopolymorpha pittospori]
MTTPPPDDGRGAAMGAAGTHAATSYSPALPTPRGPLSAAVIETLSGDRHRVLPPRATVAAADAYGEDLQLALYTCYELHYRAFAGTDGRWEWDPELLRLRGDLESAFLAALRHDLPHHSDVASALEPLVHEPVDGDGVSHFLERGGELWQVREFVAMRSLYHLKEADPHAWVIPRLLGQAKASLVAVEYDEFGAGRAARAHSQLFADLMAGLGLDPRYGRYLDAAPAHMLATVNLMSLLGLHRSLRGALVGHLAAAEITTAPSAHRMVQALRRLKLPEQCVSFYTEHVEADAVHEQVMRHDVIGDLLGREPDLTPDVIFGIDATSFLEDRLADQLLGAWRTGTTSLRQPIQTLPLLSPDP